MFNLGDVFLRLLLGDASQFQKQVQTEAEKAGTKGGKTLGQKIKDNLATGFGAVGGGLLVAATDQAAKFDDQLRTIQTVAQDLNLDKAKDDILALSRETGKSTDDLTAGFYDLVSAGVSADDAINVLRDSAKFATGALGSTAEAVDLVTSVLNAYGLEASQSTRVTDVFAKAVADGKVTAAELGGSIAQIAPIAASAGVSIEEISAGFATLTAKGNTAGVAATQMRAAIAALIKPNEQLNKIQKQTGINFTELMKAKGLSVALDELRKATNGDDAAFSEALGSVEAYQFALATTGDEAQGFADEIIKVTNSQGLAADQYEIKSKSAVEQGKRLVAQVQSFLITVGAPFVNTIGPAIFALNQLGQAFGVNGLLAKGLGAAVGGVIGRGIPAVARGVGKLLGAIESKLANSLAFQKGLTFAVEHVQIPAGRLLTKLENVFLDVFARLGDTAVGAFVKRFLASQALANLASVAGKLIGPIVVLATIVSTVDYVAAQKANVDLINAVTSGVDSATVDQLQQMREQIKVALSAEQARFDPFEDFFGLSQQNNLQTQLDALNKIIGDKMGEAGGAAAESFDKKLATGIASGIQASTPVVASVIAHMTDAVKDDTTLIGAHQRGLRTAQAVAQGMQDGKDAIKNQWSSFLNILKNAEAPAKERARLLGELTSKELQKGLHSQDPYVRATAETTKQQIIDRLNVLKSNAKNIGKDGMAELRKGMKSKDPDIRKAATDIYNAARHGSGANGPADIAKGAETWGANIDKGIAKGLRAHVNLVASAADSIAHAIGNQLVISSPAKEGPLSLAGGPEGWGKNLGSDMAKGVTGTVAVAKYAANTLAGAFVPPQHAYAGGLGYRAPGTFSAPSLAFATAGGRAGTTINVRVDGLMKARDPLELGKRLQRFAATGVFEPQETYE